MKKTITLIMSCLVLMLALGACGKSSEGTGVSASADEIAKDLAENAVTSDTLSSISADILASTYFVDMEKVEDSAAYLSTGASSCEATVIKCSDSSYASEVEGLFKTRVKNQSDLFASYNAGEVKKLDAAIIKTSGSYVVLFVGDDTDKAEDILTKAGF